MILSKHNFTKKLLLMFFIINIDASSQQLLYNTGRTALIVHNVQGVVLSFDFSCVSVFVELHCISWIVVRVHLPHIHFFLNKCNKAMPCSRTALIVHNVQGVVLSFDFACVSVFVDVLCCHRIQSCLFNSTYDIVTYPGVFYFYFGKNKLVILFSARQVYFQRESGV
jgi:ribosome-binding factor A